MQLHHTIETVHMASSKLLINNSAVARLKQVGSGLMYGMKANNNLTKVTSHYKSWVRSWSIVNNHGIIVDNYGIISKVNQISV